MKTVGIVGGIGPESTIVYYRHMLSLFRERHPSPAQPRIIINSVEAGEMLGYVSAGRRDELTAFLVSAVEALARAGADVALIAANTPHVVYDAVHTRSPIPLISIIEATSREASRLGLKRIGLLGTRTIMGGSLYADVLGRAGIAVVAPAGDDLEYVHNVYMNELFNGIIRPESRDRLLEIVERLRASEGIDALVLGGTELTIILSDVPGLGIPVLDTAKIHAAEAVEWLLAKG